MPNYATQKSKVGAHAANAGLIQHRQQTQARFFTVFTPGDEFAEHRVVERRNGVSFCHAAVDPTPRPCGRFAVEVERTGGRQEVVVRIFGIQPHFDGVACERYLILGDWQRFATGYADLPGHQIESGDGLGDRVLDLQAGVHFHEEELATGIEQELDRPGADVADGLRSLDRGFAHGPAQLSGEARGGRFLDDLLVPALDRTIALIEVEAVAMLIGEHLDLDVTRLEDVFLDQHARVAKRRLRLALGRLQRLGQISLALDHLHAFAATACSGLEQYRVANLFCSDAEGFHVLGFAVIAGHQWHAGLFHQCLGRRFAAHGIDGRGRRAKEYQAGILDGASEIGILGKEAVARMDRLRAAGLGGGD